VEIFVAEQSPQNQPAAR